MQCIRGFLRVKSVLHRTRRGGYQPPAGQRRFTEDLRASQLPEHLSVIGLRRCHLPSRGGLRAGINPAPTTKPGACRRGGLDGRPYRTTDSHKAPPAAPHPVGADYISARGTTDNAPVHGRIYNAPLRPGSMVHCTVGTAEKRESVRKKPPLGRLFPYEAWGKFQR